MKSTLRYTTNEKIQTLKFSKSIFWQFKQQKKAIYQKTVMLMEIIFLRLYYIGFEQLGLKLFKLSIPTICV
jgi:hypothetical protein